MHPGGVEQDAESQGKAGVPVSTGTESGTLSARRPTAEDPKHDPALAFVVTVWPALPTATRQRITAMVRAAIGAGGEATEGGLDRRKTAAGGGR